jgi:hypothetical protein
MRDYVQKVIKHARRFSTLALTTLSVAWMAPALAITGCPGGESNGHCYGVGTTGKDRTGTPVWLNAIGTDLYVYCLSVANRNTDFANYEAWMDTNDNVPSDFTWVEEGMKAGIGVDGNNHGFTWFWADQRPGSGGYHEHYGPGASTGTITNVSFYWLGNGNWNVERGGSVIGESTANGDWAGGGYTGVETTINIATAVGYSQNWQYADPSWDWHPAIAGTLNQSDGWLSAVADQGTPGSLVSVVNRGGCGGDVAQPKASPITDATAATRLKQIALTAAAANGEMHPVSMEFVATTRKNAQALTGEGVPENNASYLVQIRGNFTGYNASIPPHKKIPTGSYLTLTVDAATGFVSDVGLTATAVSLPALGQSAFIF